MTYRSFSDFHQGYSHVKKGSACEDYAMSYSDPDNRFHICVTCDGHSDKNCFRSKKGSEFGCLAAIDVLKKFFELYFEDGRKDYVFSDMAINRVKMSIKESWNDKVFKNLSDNPLTEDELKPLSNNVRQIYESGKLLENIYGATFLAAALCDDFFVAFHIGDGLLISVEEDGIYHEPISADTDKVHGSPASICDADLFSRPMAFRHIITKKKPLAVIVTSDGVGDCMDLLDYKKSLKQILDVFNEKENKHMPQSELNKSQKKYLNSYLEYWAGEGVGVEDDCSLAGIYSLDNPIPDIVIPLDEAEALWKETMEERNEVIQDYENRKRALIQKISAQKTTLFEKIKSKFGFSSEDIDNMDQRIIELKNILQNIVENEQMKAELYDKKLKNYSDYIIKANGYLPDNSKAVCVTTIEPEFFADKELIVLGKKVQSQEPDENDNKNSDDNTDDYTDIGEEPNNSENTDEADNSDSVQENDTVNPE